jgi:hypothetical protein
MMEEEINSLDISVEKDGKGNTPCMKKVLRENRDVVIESPVQPLCHTLSEQMLVSRLNK